jgi:ribonuclease inhibitor
MATQAIDLSDVTTNSGLHALLKRELGFPVWYGGNWSALWDAITGLVDLPEELVFTGWETYSRRSPEDARMLRTVFDRFAEQYNSYGSTVRFE